MASTGEALGKILSIGGLLLVIAQLIYLVISPTTSEFVIYILLGGFASFILGAEIYMRKRKEIHEI
jgi:hypothetical protein